MALVEKVTVGDTPFGIGKRKGVVRFNGLLDDTFMGSERMKSKGSRLVAADKLQTK